MPTREHGTDGPHIIDRELGIRVTFTDGARLTTLREHVTHVVRMRSKEEVIGVHACAHIAAVAHAHSVGN